MYVIITEITADNISGEFYDSTQGRHMLKGVLVGLIKGHFENYYAEDQYINWKRLNLGANHTECKREFNIIRLL